MNRPETGTPNPDATKPSEPSKAASSTNRV